MKALATLPTAFFAGLVGTLGIHAFERWAYEHQLGLTRASGLAEYGLFVAGPFLLCVVGLDSRRWEHNYWFSDIGKADARQTSIRWAVYFIGGIIGYSLT